MTHDALISPACALASLCQHMNDDDALAWMREHMRTEGELAGYVLASELPLVLASELPVVA